MPTRQDDAVEEEEEAGGCWEGIAPDWKVAERARAAGWLLDLLWPASWSRAPGARKPLRRTAYLDGLRGFAALLVYWGHHQMWAHDGTPGSQILENAFGFERHYHFACLPAIRTFFSGGHYSVTVFFVISGYVLSTKPLGLIQAGDFLQLGDNLASALFRRWLRLHLPVICVTFLYMTSWHALGIWTDAEHRPTYREELWNWYAEFKNFSFVFRTGGENWFSYDFHVWSIPVEFRGSIVVYTSLLAFSRCTRNARLWGEVGLIVYFMYVVDGWFCSMFAAGMLLCDLDLLAAKKDLPRFFVFFEPFKELIFFNLFIVSLCLGGVPSHSSEMDVLRASPGWYYLSFLKPQAAFDYKWFYLLWASTFLVASIPHIPWLKRFFETRFNQYLGRISFAFYLVHGPVIWILGDRLYAATGWSRKAHATGIPGWVNLFPISSAGPLGLEMSFLLPHLILLPVTIWLAEIVTKLVDQPSVKFAQWAYEKTLAPPTKS